MSYSTKVAYIMLTLLCTFTVIHSALLFPRTTKVLRLYKHGAKEPCDNCCVSVPDTTSYRALPHRNKCHKATATETTSNNLHATFFIFLYWWMSEQALCILNGYASIHQHEQDKNLSESSILTFDRAYTQMCPQGMELEDRLWTVG